MVRAIVLCQQYQVVVAAPGRVSVEAATLGYVGFDPQDRLDADLASALVELDGTEHVAMIGQGDGRHAKGLRPFEDVLEAVGAVEQAELAVEVEMGEVGHGACA